MRREIPDEYKVSLRTNSEVDVSRIAQSFGGGGHVKAAGCTMTGKPEEIAEKISGKIKEQWDENAAFSRVKIFWNENSGTVCP